jgi:peptidoglycan/LPS O-acetylase OafA/YrhL
LKDADSRLPFLDLLRALSSQAIVWHHLAFYGPLSDSAREVATSLIDGLSHHARLAVQVFFVVSGYLTAVGLQGREPSGLREFRALIAARYRRIGLPYLGAMALAIVANEIARHWMDHPSISARPSPGQLLAHVFLIHDLVGYEPLSAGIWYLAIDLQLTVLVALVFWLCARAAGAERGPRWGRGVLGLLSIASLFWFNRQPGLDRVAIYFMGAYGLGLVTAWVRAGSLRRRFFWSYAALVAIAMAIDFRSRLLVALTTGLLLTLAAHFDWLGNWPRSRTIRWFAGISYSLFLIHFPVSLVVNALWSSHVPRTPSLSLLGMLTAYAFSLGGAVLFHYEVEQRLVRMGRPKPSSLDDRLATDGDKVACGRDPTG